MNLKKKRNKSLGTASWAEVTRLFHKLSDLEPKTRIAVLRESTRGNPEIRREVEFLLNHSADLAGFLEEPIAPKAARALFGGPTEVFGPGDRIDDFVIIRILGTGAFATVYLARQISLDREIALKVSANVGEEAKTMAHLEHDNIVKVFSETIDRKRNLRLICMQYVPGVSLDKLLERLRKTPVSQLSGGSILDILCEISDVSALDPGAMKERDKLADLDFCEAILWMGTSLAQALAYAHEKGILHLDVKPSNVIVSVYGRPMLTDFNVSIDARTGRDSIPENFGGTFNYMAPEQREVFHAPEKLLALARIDQRADIFSLGVVIRELLGKFPISEETRTTLEHATDPSPAKRFPQAHAFAQALDGCNELRAIAKTLPPLDGWLERSSAHPLIALTLIGAIPQLVACGVGISYNTIRIVRHLTQAQQVVFNDLNLLYNPAVYAIATIVWIKLVLRLAPYLRDRKAFFDDQSEVKALRRHALRLPLWGIAVTTFGWVPGSLLFPLVIHLKAGPLPLAVFGHFLLSFNLSWLIAMSYSFLLQISIVLRLLYPRFFMGANQIRKTARADVGMMPKLVHWSIYLAGLIPLLGATLLLQVGPDMLNDQSYRSFQMLVTFLIGLGVTGIFFAFDAGEKLAVTVFAATAKHMKSKD